MDNYERCVELVLSDEGGLTRNPKDHGNWTGGEIGLGELKGTKYGISASAYPELDIVNLTYDDAKRIYRTDYWHPVGCDSLPLPLAYLTFDNAVNAGLSRAAKWLQRAVNVDDDGVVGSITIAAANCVNLEKTVVEISARKMFHYMRQSSMVEVFGLGWARRGIGAAVTAIKFIEV